MLGIDPNNILRIKIIINTMRCCSCSCAICYWYAKAYVCLNMTLVNVFPFPFLLTNFKITEFNLLNFINFHNFSQTTCEWNFTQLHILTQKNNTNKTTLVVMLKRVN